MTEFINLDKKMSDDELDVLLKSHNDTMPKIAEYDLSDSQLDKLSPAEKGQYYEIRRNHELHQKNMLNQAHKHFRQQMKELGIESRRQQRCKHVYFPESRKGPKIRYQTWIRIPVYKCRNCHKVIPRDLNTT